MTVDAKRLTRFQRWLDNWPSTNGKLLTAMLLVVATVTLDMVGGFALMVWLVGHPGRTLAVPDIVEHVITSAHWLVAGYAGIGAAQFVGKRATEDPNIVAAHAAAQVATTTATTTTTTAMTAPVADPAAAHVAGVAALAVVGGGGVAARPVTNADLVKLTGGARVDDERDEQ